MNKKDLEFFKGLLLKKRAELVEEIESIKSTDMNTTTKEASGDHSSYAYHMADQGTDNMQREKSFLYAQRNGRLIYHIDMALERIEDGTFGLCQSCGKQITRERLEAVPHARLCIECKNGEEKSVPTGPVAGEIV